MSSVRIALQGLVCAFLAGPLSAAEPSVPVANLATETQAPSLAEPPAGQAAEQSAAAPVASPAAASPRTDGEPPSAPLGVLPGRQGYAFDKPGILARQRIFGLAHGVSLLAAACLDLPEQTEAIESAYAAWHKKQAVAIETVVHDLAQYYFGSRAADAQWLDLVRALGLKEDISTALGEFTLEVACATLPHVLDKPRYDLAALLADPRLFDPQPTVLPSAPAVPPPSAAEPDAPSAAPGLPAPTAPTDLPAHD